MADPAGAAADTAAPSTASIAVMPAGAGAPSRPSAPGAKPPESGGRATGHRKSLTAAAARRQSSRDPNMGKTRTSKTRLMYQNSYRMEPAVRFNTDRAKAVMKRILDSNLERGSKKYPLNVYPELAKALAADIRDRVKELKFERFKLVCIVTIGQKVGTSLIIASRCLSDSNVDTFAEYTYENMELFCTATVHAIYYE